MSYIAYFRIELALIDYKRASYFQLEETISLIFEVSALIIFIPIRLLLNTYLKILFNVLNLKLLTKIDFC